MARYSFPAGNQIWKLRSKSGRDALFATADAMWEAACKYFDWCDKHPLVLKEAIKSGDNAGTTMDVPTARPYTWQGLTRYLNCNTQYFSEFEKKQQPGSDFSIVINNIREVIYQQKFEWATVGVFNSNIISRDLGLADKQEARVTATNFNHDAGKVEDLTPERIERMKEIAKQLDDEY